MLFDVIWRRGEYYRECYRLIRIFWCTGRPCRRLAPSNRYWKSQADEADAVGLGLCPANRPGQPIGRRVVGVDNRRQQGCAATEQDIAELSAKPAVGPL